VLLSIKEIKIALYGRLSEKGLLNICETGIRSQTVDWLPQQNNFRTFCMSDEAEKVYQKLEEVVRIC